MGADSPNGADGWDVRTLAPTERYKLLTGLVVPRPIAWVSTISAQGVVNAAPFSFFNAVGDAPPMVMVSIDGAPGGGLKDTSRNAVESGEFVVNLVDEGLAEAMNATSAPFGPEVSEPEVVGLALAPSQVVEPPRLADAPASFECRLHTVVPFDDRRILFGEVVWIWTRPGLIDPATKRVDLDAYHPVGRLFGSYYTRISDRFSMRRPE